MSDASVGIAIPFWSGLPYLEAALRSLLAQTDPDWTAVVVDDASPEPGAAALVERLASPRLTYVRNESNLGLAGNFNRCLEVTGADLVTIFHADDLLAPEYVATVRAGHRRAPEAVCVAVMARAIDARGAEIDTLADRVKRLLWPKQPVVQLSGDRGLARLMHGQFIYCPAVSYRVVLLPELRFDPRWRQVMDLDLFARLLLTGGTFLLDRRPMYRYRHHPGTVTQVNTATRLKFEEEARVAEEVAVAAGRLGWHRTRWAARIRWTTRANRARTLLAARSGRI
jgi:glycosyltransferase involved in cell wall biosynthesis